MAANRIFSKIILGVVLTVFIFKDGALAGSREHLDGLGKFQFGMTEEQISSKIKIVKKVDKREGVFYLKSEEKELVPGLSKYSVFYLSNYKLDSVSLNYNRKGTLRSCEMLFDGQVKRLNSKYGAPDKKAVKHDIGHTIIGVVRFSFNDGNAIDVSMFFGKGEGSCGVDVDYNYKD